MQSFIFYLVLDIQQEENKATYHVGKDCNCSPRPHLQLSKIEMLPYPQWCIYARLQGDQQNIFRIQAILKSGSLLRHMCTESIIAKMITVGYFLLRSSILGSMNPRLRIPNTFPLFEPWYNRFTLLTCPVDQR